MTTPPVPESELTRTLEAYIQNERNASATARALSMPEGTIRHRIKMLARTGRLGTDPVMPGFAISKTSATYSADGQIKSRTIAQKPDSGEAFQLPEGHQIKGVSAYLDADGNTIARWVKTREGELSVEEITAQIKAGFEGVAKVLIPEAEIDTEADLATVIPLADWHVGLLAWHRETGQDWDLSIAEETIMSAVRRCVMASPPSAICVILGLGDMLHLDGYEPVTARSGNQLDVDGRYPKVLRTASRMLCATIELAAARHGKVLVRVLPGNHDTRSALALTLALSMRYEEAERVTVDDSPSYFWWWRWGKVFLGATHGDKTKMKDLPLVMAADRPEDWAASSYRKVMTGHIHHESKIEQGGVIVESLRSPVAKDAYHSFERFRAGRTVYADTYHRNGEDVSRMSVNIPQPPKAA